MTKNASVNNNLISSCSYNCSYCHPQRPFASLAALLAALSTHSPPVKRVVEWCNSQYGEGNIPPKEVRSLLISLSKPSPVCALLPATEEARELMQQMIASDVKENPQLLRVLQTLCPVLFNVVKALQWTGGSLPEAFSSLLTELWRKSIAAFQTAEPVACTIASTSTSTSTSASSSTVSVASHRWQLPVFVPVSTVSTCTSTGSTGTSTTASPSTSTSSSANSSTDTTASTSTGTSSTDAETDSFLDSVVCWPHLARVRERETYPMDMNRDTHSCTKQGKGHKTLLPGTVTLHCQHGRLHYTFVYILLQCLSNFLLLILMGLNFCDFHDFQKITKLNIHEKRFSRKLISLREI